MQDLVDIVNVTTDSSSDHTGNFNSTTCTLANETSPLIFPLTCSKATVILVARNQDV